ncbi:MAG: hypothetical protein J6U35_03600 [Clostridia bacterium]|nr:hypothetical protein [Clostridia bacterium]
MKKIILAIVAALLAAITLTSFASCGKFSLQMNKLATDEELETFIDGKEEDSFFKNGLTISIKETTYDFGSWGENTETVTATVKVDSKGNMSFNAKSTLKSRRVNASGTQKGKGKASEKLIMVETEKDGTVYYIDTEYNYSSKNYKTSVKEKFITDDGSEGNISGSILDNVYFLFTFMEFEEDYFDTYYYFIDGDNLTVVQDGFDYLVTCVFIFKGKEFKEAQLTYKANGYSLTIHAKSGNLAEIKDPDTKGYKDT